MWLREWCMSFVTGGFPLLVGLLMFLFHLGAHGLAQQEHRRGYLPDTVARAYASAFTSVAWGFGCFFVFRLLFMVYWVMELLCFYGGMILTFTVPLYLFAKIGMRFPLRRKLAFLHTLLIAAYTVMLFLVGSLAMAWRPAVH